MDDTWIAQEFGEQLRARRLERGLKQEQVADEAGLSRTSIVNIEAGRQGVALSTLYRLAGALGVEPGDLLPSPRSSSHKLNVAIGGIPDKDAHVLGQVMRSLERSGGSPE